MFVEKKVFDPELQGEAVYLVSKDDRISNGVYIVNGAEGDHLALMDCFGVIEDFSVNYFDVDGNELHVLEKPHIAPGKKINRVRGYTSKQRTRAEVRKESDWLVSVLRENIEPIPLRELIRKMRLNGFDHWTSKNATSYIKSAMRNGYPITKPEYGHYCYDWKGENNAG